MCMAGRSNQYCYTLLEGSSEPHTFLWSIYAHYLGEVVAIQYISYGVASHGKVLVNLAAEFLHYY